MRRRLLLLLAVCILGIGDSLGPDRWSSRRLNHMMNRVRRSEPCPRTYQYRPYGKDFCCDKCSRGHFKVEHCKAAHTATNCSECKKGTFRQHENYEKNCISCLDCDPVFQQIEKEECTIYSNRVCGCPRGMYQSRIDSTIFNCKNCSSCEHGVILECSGSSDTVCFCDRDHYYHSQKKNCQPCDSCDTGFQCPSLCEKKPEDSTDGALLSVAIVACSALILLAIITVGYQVYRKWKRPTVSKHQSKTGNSSDSELTICNADTLLPIQEVTASSAMVIYPTPITELPDCVRIAGASRLPNSSRVNYLIADLVPLAKWKEFVRRLGMSDRDIERNEMDNRHSCREAQYEMVKLWRDKQGGRGGTTEAICKVLKDMDLNGCAEQFQESLQ